MNWRIWSQAKGIWVGRAFLVGRILGCGIFLAGLGGFGWAAEARAPAGKSAAEADLPDMPAPEPKTVSEAKEAAGAGKAEAGPAKPEAQPSEKGRSIPPDQPKSAPGGQPSGSPKLESKGPAEPTPKTPEQPAGKPKSEPTTPPKEESPGKEKAEASAKAKAQPPTKQKVADPILEWPVNEAHRKTRTDLVQLLRAGSLNPDQLKLLTEYYTEYELARWTQMANRAEVRKFREELLRQLAQAEGQTHDQVVQIVLNLLLKMAEGNHHPVARVNAVLALGELNRVEPRGTKPPEPLPAAQPILFQMVQNAQMPEMLRVAALVGLRRHVELGAVADPTKTQWATGLLSLVQERSSSGRASAGRDWLRQLAIEVLELLKTPGPNGQVALALIELLADTNQPMSIRVAAARAVGNLHYSQGFPADLNKLIREMGQLALDAINTELETYQKEKKLLPRRLQTHLIGVYNGLNGLQKTASQPKETADLYQKVLDAVRDCAVLFESSKLRDEDGNLLEDDFVKQLTKQKTALSEAIAAPVPPAQSQT